MRAGLISCSLILRRNMNKVFNVKMEITIDEIELKNYARKYLGEDYKEWYSEEEILEEYLVNYMDSEKRKFRKVRAEKIKEK